MTNFDNEIKALERRIEVLKRELENKKKIKEIFERNNGIFKVVIHDKGKDKVVFANDVYEIKRLEITFKSLEIF